MMEAQPTVWLKASLLLLMFAKSAFAECVPLDPTTREECIKLILNEKTNGGQFTNIRWRNRCDAGINVKWSSDKMGFTELVPARSTWRTQCYSFCGEISWHAICPNQSSTNQPHKTKVSSRDASFCALYHDADTRASCYLDCTKNPNQDARSCTQIRTEVLPHLQANGDASYGSSGTSISTAGARPSHRCERGQIWSNATTGRYRCECPAGESLDMGKPCAPI
jgi:hypothetical protein